MICARCHTPTVTWRGPLTALTHTECSKCGGVDIQSPDDFDYLDEPDECPNCGGESVTYDCIDGMCLDAERGCEFCERECEWCGGKG
jgi:hypothetical protein